MWFWWSLISAIFGALATIIIKHSLKRISPMIITWALFVFPIPILFLIFLQNPKITINSWFWLGVCGSSLLFAFSKLWSTQAIQTGLLSKLVPLNSLSTLFIYVWGLIFFGEQISLISFIGVISIVSGTYLLNAESARENIFQPIIFLFKNRNTALYILAMLIGSIVSIFDKTALINTHPQSPIFTSLMENIIALIPFTLYIMKKESQFLSKIKTHFWTLLLLGVVYICSVITLFYGFIDGTIVLSSAIRHTQIIMIMILGYFLFADKPPKRVWLATLIMILGVVLVKVG